LKGTLLVENFTFTVVSGIPFEGLFENPHLALKSVSVYLRSANS